MQSLASKSSSRNQLKNSLRYLSRGGKHNTTKRPRIKSSEGGVESTWYSSTKPQRVQLEMGKYGLKRLNYQTLEAPVWTLPPQPPTKKLTEKIVFPLTLVATAGIGLWVYMNPEEDDMREYWKKVETGQILIDDDDDEDWDDEEDEN